MVLSVFVVDLYVFFRFLYGMKHTVQEFLLHHDLLGVQIFHIMEKGLFVVQMIKSKAQGFLKPIYGPVRTDLEIFRPIYFASNVILSVRKKCTF